MGMHQDGKEYWKKNLFFIWLSQFLSLAGFSSCMPFIPKVMEEYLGITDRALRLQFISAYHFCGMISLCVAMIVWGMLVASQFCSSNFLSASGIGSQYLVFVDNPFLLFIFFRNIQPGTDSCCFNLTAGKAWICAWRIEYSSLEWLYARLSAWRSDCIAFRLRDRICRWWSFVCSRRFTGAVFCKGRFRQSTGDCPVGEN